MWNFAILTKTLESHSWGWVQEEYIRLGGKRQHHLLKPLAQEVLILKRLHSRQANHAFYPFNKIQTLEAGGGQLCVILSVFYPVCQLTDCWLWSVPPVSYVRRSRQHRWRFANVTFHCANHGLCDQWIRLINEQLLQLSESYSQATRKLDVNLNLPCFDIKKSDQIILILRGPPVKNNGLLDLPPLGGGVNTWLVALSLNKGRLKRYWWLHKECVF